jgi:hypothetical protein
MNQEYLKNSVINGRLGTTKFLLTYGIKFDENLIIKCISKGNIDGVNVCSMFTLDRLTLFNHISNAITNRNGRYVREVELGLFFANFLDTSIITNWDLPFAVFCGFINIVNHYLNYRMMVDYTEIIKELFIIAIASNNIFMVQHIYHLQGNRIHKVKSALKMICVATNSNLDIFRFLLDHLNSVEYQIGPNSERIGGINYYKTEILEKIIVNDKEKFLKYFYTNYFLTPLESVECLNLAIQHRSTSIVQYYSSMTRIKSTLTLAKNYFDRPLRLSFVDRLIKLDVKFEDPTIVYKMAFNGDGVFLALAKNDKSFLPWFMTNGGTLEKYNSIVFKYI